MIKIAVLDDDPLQLEMLSDLLKEYIASNKLNAILSTFSSAKELLFSREKNGAFDIYILDIIMPEKNGMVLAKELKACGDKGKILFLTSSPDFVFDAFDVNASGYLLKPLNTDAMDASIKKIISELEDANAESVTVNTLYGPREIPVAELVYIENKNRRARYYIAGGDTADGVFSMKSLKKTAKPFLDTKLFAFVTPDIIVGLSYVDSFDKSTRTVQLKDGKTFTVSPRKLPKFKRAFTGYKFTT